MRGQPWRHRKMRITEVVLTISTQAYLSKRVSWCKDMICVVWVVHLSSLWGWYIQLSSLHTVRWPNSVINSLALMPHTPIILLITIWLLMGKFTEGNWKQPPQNDGVKRLTTPELNKELLRKNIDRNKVLSSSKTVDLPNFHTQKGLGTWYIQLLKTQVAQAC